MSNFRYDSLHAPTQPEYTCPRIDGIIEELELLRQENSDLREHGDYWQEKAEEYATEGEGLEKERDQLGAEVQEKEKEITRLESAIRELEYQIKHGY